jgi:hypothetical protein
MVNVRNMNAIMNSEIPGSEGAKGGDDAELPAANQVVWVQCEGYRTLAYRDEQGTWKTFAGGRELEGPVKVLGTELGRRRPRPLQQLNQND